MGLRRNRIILLILICLGTIPTNAQDVTITVNANQGKRAVSPNIYGRNEGFDEFEKRKDLSEEQKEELTHQFLKDAGLRFARMNGGNNATKYNWRKKISSHPDWYNNVYGNDWDATSKKIANNHPDMKVMWAFQLLGRVASSNAYNFNDWGYNQSNWWQGVYQNLAGGGVPNEAKPDGKATVEGDVELYTEEWPADSTVGILDHWFGAEGIGLNKKQFLYWNMDNEPDVWDGTHDDVMSDGLLPANEFMDNYIEVAKKARALFPEIKLCGPVATSEWQWYSWSGGGTKIDGKNYCWLEYFIKRCADEEKKSGIRVLDVVDLHNYPDAPTDAVALQNHRMYYDKTYIYPGANGVKTVNGGWDNSQNKEYIFQRINDWLDKYYGANHGITLGLSEWSPGPSEPNLASVIYATHLGTFANNGVECFTPWNWFTGMWESLHLFSRYAKEYSVSSTSSLENTVSAYTTVTENSDSTTVIIVNRDMSASHKVTVSLNGLLVHDGEYKTLQLSSLPAKETFESHTKNALKAGSVAVASNSFSITVPALSTTAIILKSEPTGISELNNEKEGMKVFPNPVSDELFVRIGSNISEIVEITINDQRGCMIQNSHHYSDGVSPVSLNTKAIPNGFYFVTVKKSNGITTKKIAVIKDKK